MTDREKVIKGLECCLSGKHPIPCDKCNYFGDKEYNDAWSCRLSLMRDALSMLKAQEQRHRLEVHNIGNVDIPDGVTNEQFHAVMNNVVAALEHTDRGESWPYEPPKEG